MAEALNSLFEAECVRNPAIRPDGDWKNVTGAEVAVAEYIDWCNHRRLRGQGGHVPPAELEPTTGTARPRSGTLKRALTEGGAK